MVASFLGFTETMSVLLEAKADPNITDKVKLHYSHCLYNRNLGHFKLILCFSGRLTLLSEKMFVSFEVRGRV